MLKLISFNSKVADHYFKPDNAEMSEIDHNFLVYLLDNLKPKKILELGVAAGGTSCLLLKHTAEGQCVYGVDLATNYYRIPSELVGFEIEKNCSKEERERHTLLTGCDIVDCIEEIGSGIDFCLLDTSHVLPGELLQFFIVYPYLSDHACLVLHDLSLNFHPERQDKATLYSYFSYSTKILFCSLGSKCKMLPDQAWPNIGAVMIDSETKKSIDSTFFALGVSWFEYPANLINKYRRFIATHYDPFCRRIFNQCIKNQARLASIVHK